MSLPRTAGPIPVNAVIVDGSTLEVRTIRAPDGQRFVAIATKGGNGGVDLLLPMTPDVARRVAQALLEDADEIEGAKRS